MKTEYREKKYIINGYVAVKRSDHPRKMQDNLIYEHILIAEKILGVSPLPDGYEVHHLSMNRLDNRKRNLLILPTKGQHTKLHNWIDRMGLQPLIEETNDGEYSVEQCLNCNEYILNYDNEKFCDRNCQNEYYKQNKHIPVSKEELSAMIDTMNKVEIANKFGVSNSTVYSWFKDYEMA